MMAVLLVGAAVTAYAGNSGDGVKVKGSMIKQGPLAKVGLDLANLHAEYKAHTDREGSGEGFNPTNPLLPVVGNRGVIDAVAVGDAEALAGDLEGLGLQQGSSFGRVVSGQLPIGAIVSAAALRGWPVG